MMRRIALPGGKGTMPMVGLGTQDMVNWKDAERIGKACAFALKHGYRHFDCAPAYQNHKAVGEYLKKGMKEYGVKREDIFVTSKLGNDGHKKQDVRKHLERTLKELGMDYLDTYLIHWPWPNYHPPGCDGDFINPESRHYVHELYMETYHEIEKAHIDGLVRAGPGVSNMTVPKMQLLLKDCSILPVCNQVEIHPHFQQRSLVDWHHKHHIPVVGYMPLGSPGRAERDKAPWHTEDLKDPVLVSLAKKKGWSVGQAALKFTLQRGVVVIPQSANEGRIIENFNAGLLEDYSDEEMEMLNGIDKNCRLIMGQVFNWKKGMDWHDLWDDLGSETWDGPINGSQAKECPAV